MTFVCKGRTRMNFVKNCRQALSVYSSVPTTQSRRNQGLNLNEVHDWTTDLKLWKEIFDVSKFNEHFRKIFARQKWSFFFCLWIDSLMCFLGNYYFQTFVYTSLHACTLCTIYSWNWNITWSRLYNIIIIIILFFTSELCAYHTFEAEYLFTAAIIAKRYVRCVYIDWPLVSN